MDSSSNPYVQEFEEGKVSAIERNPPLHAKHTHFLSASNLNTQHMDKLIHFKPDSKIINLKNMKFFYSHNSPTNQPKLSALSRHFSQTSHQVDLHRHRTANESTQSYNFEYRQMRNPTPQQSVKMNNRQSVSFFSSHLNTLSPKRSDDNLQGKPSFHHPVLRAPQRLRYKSYALPPLRITEPTLDFSVLKKLYFIVSLSQIGIADERAERVLQVREVGNFEEILAYIFEDQNEGKFNHRFQPHLKGALLPQERCDLCEKKHRLSKPTEPGSPQFKRLPTANLFFCGDQVLMNNEKMEKIIEMQEQQSEQSVVAVSLLRTQLSRALSIRSLDPKNQQGLSSPISANKFQYPSEREVSRSPSRTRLKPLIFPSSEVEDTLPQHHDPPKIESTKIVTASGGALHFLPVPESLYLRAGSRASSQSVLNDHPERMIESPRQLVKPLSSTITHQQDDVYCGICGETEEMHSPDYNLTLTLKEEQTFASCQGILRNYRSSTNTLFNPFQVSHNLEGSVFELVIRDKKSQSFSDCDVEGLCSICYEFQLSTETECCKFPLCNQCKHKLGDSYSYCPFCWTQPVEEQDSVLVISEKALLEEYNNIGEGRWIQYCPRCYSAVMRAHRCHNHLFCSKCQLQFCLYCRHKFTSSHFNPFSKSPCKHLRIQKVPENSHPVKQATVVSEALVRFNKSRKKKCLLTLLLLLVSPFLSLFILPYFLASEARYSFRYSRIRREIEKRIKKANQQIESSSQDLFGRPPSRNVVTERENAKFFFGCKEGAIFISTWVLGVALSPVMECVVLGVALFFFTKVFT